MQIIPFGAASVGLSLGIMATQKRFPRPSVVFLDGDQDLSDGIFVLPGEDAPEQVVFEGLKALNWPDVAERLVRPVSTVIDALNKAMTLGNHHDWTKNAADVLFVGTSHLWQAMCAAWIAHCTDETQRELIVGPVRSALENT